ncbi:MAG: hypothetical protein GOU97_00705 [Nanoarchaeota archaeon]|nr:hypothetical protein [Nanoarchaeota archaeon]
MDNNLELWIWGTQWPHKRENDSSEVRLEEIMQPLLERKRFPEILETDNPEIHVRLRKERDLDLTDVSEKFTPVLSSLNTLVSLYDQTQQPVPQKEITEYKLDKKMIAIPVITGISTFILSTAMGLEPLLSGAFSISTATTAFLSYDLYEARKDLKQTKKHAEKHFKQLRDYRDFHESLTGDHPNNYIVGFISENAHNIGSIKFLSDDPKITLVNV